MLRVAPPRKTRPPDHIRVNWPVDASASGLAQVGPGGCHRWAARVQVGQEPARQKAREGYPSHYTSLVIVISIASIQMVLIFNLKYLMMCVIILTLFLKMTRQLVAISPLVLLMSMSYQAIWVMVTHWIAIIMSCSAMAPTILVICVLIKWMPTSWPWW